MKQITFTKRIRLGHTKKLSYVLTIPKRDVFEPLELEDGSIVEVKIRKIK